MPAGTGQVPNPLTATRMIAERAARQRLLNCFLRETGRPADVDGPLLRVPLPAAGAVLLAEVEHWSVLGQHCYGEKFQLQQPDGTAVPVAHHDLVAALLTELAAVAIPAAGDSPPGQRHPADLTARIDNSVQHTARYLAHHRPPRPAGSDSRGLTRWAEQSLLFGHPFHPTPKSAEGFTAGDLAAYTPELGASFALHYFAIAPELLVEHRWSATHWVPCQVQERAAELLGTGRDGYPLLPVHPWQAGYLRRQPALDAVVADGGLVALGPLGGPVYPTSSVRTVCDPTFGTSWKLPLHVRITNFVRNNPGAHARRAVDASRLIRARRDGWRFTGFDVLLETGYRSIEHPTLAPDLTVLYRDNPFATRPEAPQVVAGLLEEDPDGAEPELLRQLRQAIGRPRARPAAGPVVEWLGRYLEISLLPLLAVFSAHGISLEAHVQNSLLHLEGGWPVRFWVRDMEGTSVSRARWAAMGPCDAISADSPVLYDDAEAWSRLKYYVVTNHLGHLVHVLGRYTDADESRLWRVVRDTLCTVPPDRYVDDLLECPTLPAKANLISCFAGRGEAPRYVDIPNPMSCGPGRR
jgi:siderophore synthetase component